MSRFFLHLKSFNGDVIKDEVGSEHPSLIAAQKEALETMNDFVADAIRRGDDIPCKVIVIADEAGTHVAAVPIVAALPDTVVNLIKAPEKVISGDRLQEYRRFAEDCRAKAEGTDNVDDKMSWLKLANAWLLMLPPDHSQGPDLTDWPSASETESKTSH